jgi:predicted dehydrogenase
MLGGVSAALLAARFSGAANTGFPLGADSAERVRVGVIGPGSRGKELIRQLLHVPNVEIRAVCDVYEPRFGEVNALVGRAVPGTKDYRELLARKDIDAVFIATPLALHAEHVTAALESGRPVFGEKALAFTPEECQAVLREAIKPGRIFQIGHEYRYATWVKEAMAKIQAGAIGEPTHVYAYWHRNDSWRRPVPEPSLEHLINWRLYVETSGGLVTELGSHQIDIANWVFGASPTRALGSTSIVKYHDGRTVGDNVQAVFEYRGGRRLFFSALTDNAKEGNQLWVYGTEGSIEITVEDATLYYEPKAEHHTAANAEILQHGITTGASYSTSNEMPYRGPGERLTTPETEDPTLTSCAAFIDCVRSGQQPLANARIGFASAVASAVAHKAVISGEALSIPAAVA